jgi:hypothetical protein
MLETWAARFGFSELTSNCIIWGENIILVALTAKGLNFDGFKSDTAA